MMRQPPIIKPLTGRPRSFYLDDALYAETLENARKEDIPMSQLVSRLLQDYNKNKNSLQYIKAQRENAESILRDTNGILDHAVREKEDAERAIVSRWNNLYREWLRDQTKQIIYEINHGEDEREIQERMWIRSAGYCKNSGFPYIEAVHEDFKAEFKRQSDEYPGGPYKDKYGRVFRKEWEMPPYLRTKDFLKFNKKT